MQNVASNKTPAQANRLALCQLQRLQPHCTSGSGPRSAARSRRLDCPATSLVGHALALSSCLERVFFPSSQGIYCAVIRKIA